MYRYRKLAGGSAMQMVRDFVWWLRLTGAFLLRKRVPFVLSGIFYILLAWALFVGAVGVARDFFAASQALTLATFSLLLLLHVDEESWVRLGRLVLIMAQLTACLAQLAHGRIVWAFAHGVLLLLLLVAMRLASR
jgi:hypothetical protein